MNLKTYLPSDDILRKMTDIVPTGIIIHHTAGNSTSSPEDINHWFIVGRAAEGYTWCGYHALIYQDGTVVQMRPFTKNGGHCPGYNKTHIGISFVGNYDKESPTAAMLTAYSDLVASLKNQFPGIQDITNHRDANARISAKYTLCPGKYLYPLSKQTTPVNTSVPAHSLQDYTTDQLLDELKKRYAAK